MVVYRISSSTYADDLSGVGAGLYGGRWNPIGMNVVYTSGSISLASLEYLVHNFHILNTKNVALVKIEIEDDLPIYELDEDDLPFDWQEKTYTPQSTQNIGRDVFESNKHYLLKVPSAIVPNEYNVLLNPRHEVHINTQIVETIDPFVIDERLSF